MEAIADALADHLVWVLIIVAFVIGMIIKAITAVITNSARERSRREIAAYVAEGSITPEQGERLLAARVKGGSCNVT